MGTPTIACNHETLPSRGTKGRKDKEIKTENDNTPSTILSWADTSVNNDDISHWAKQIITILMHIASLVNIHWKLLAVSSGNENQAISRADNSAKMTNFVF